MDNSLLKRTARELRKRSTRAERLFWDAVRDRKLDGLKFIRQYPIPFEYDGIKRFFIADFYCHEHRLAVEIDGLIHDRQQDYDKLRTFIINHLGMRVLRIRNTEIETDIQPVLSRLRRELFL